MPKTYNDWLNLTPQKNLPPVLGIGGDERAFIDEAVTSIKSLVLSSGMSDFNFDIVNGRQCAIDDVLSLANTLPMMAPLRLVLVKEADGIKSDDVDAIERYLASPNTTTILLFVFSLLDARQRLPKLLDNQNALYKFDHPRDDQMPALIKKRGRSYELSFDDEAASALWMEIGTDLLMLDRALEKLSLACTNGVVTTRIIMDQVAETRLVDAFGLGRAVAMGNKNQAIEYMGKLKAAQEVPLKLVGMLAWQLRQVLKARLALDEGKSETVIGQSLNMYGDRLKPVVTAARKWPTQVHIVRLTKLTELDRELKRSRAPSWLWLENVVINLCETNRL